MDVVLEIFDTFLFDRLYAMALPASKATYLNNMLKDVVVPSPTFSSMREAPTAIHHASQFLSLQPGPYAYMSALPRDSAWRQGISLYLITWYVDSFSSLAKTPASDSNR